MGLSDADVQKQLRHMMAFIEQEANEKAEEIDAKAEEEFNIEKGRLVQMQRAKVMDYYTKKEKQVELQRKIQTSNLANQTRLQVLKAREDHITTVLDEATNNLSKLSTDPQQYPKLLRGLIKEAMMQILEPDTVLRCRKQDEQTIKDLLDGLVDEIKRELPKDQGPADFSITIDEKNYLPPKSTGGVEVYRKDMKIKVVSTLEDRLNQISQQMLPDIRAQLFGENPNRRFKD